MVVASKVPLPNYRPDLDDKRPQREVISLGVSKFIFFVLASWWGWSVDGAWDIFYLF